MGAGFAGTAENAPEMLSDWALGAHLADREKHMGERRECLRWNCSLGIMQAINTGRGGVLYCRRGDGNIGAASAFWFENGNQHSWSRQLTNAVFLYFFVIGRRLGLPPFYFMPGVMPRLERALAMCDHFHHHNAPGPHLYTYMMSTGPGNQGQGFCSKIMRTQTAMSDSRGLPCYLETGGARNQAVYARYGYSVAETGEVKGEDPGDEALEYSCMVRPKKSSQDR